MACRSHVPVSARVHNACVRHALRVSCGVYLRKDDSRPHAFQGKGTLVKVGSREEFESIMSAVEVRDGGAGGSSGGGGGGNHNYSYKKEKQEQASVEDVLSAAEQFALRFL